MNPIIAINNLKEEIRKLEIKINGTYYHEVKNFYKQQIKSLNKRIKMYMK